MEVVNYDRIQDFSGRDFFDPYPPQRHEPVISQPIVQRSLDPAVFLPFEITSYIFEKYVKSMSAPFLCPSQGPWHYPCDAYRVVLPCWVPLRLGAVCHRWRQIAWDSPALWTEMLVDMRPSKCNGATVELVRQWIDRTGSLPMRIRVFRIGERNYTNSSYWHGSNYFTDFMNIINELAPRWQSIDFDRVPIDLISKLNDAACTEDQPSILSSITLGGHNLNRRGYHTPEETHKFFVRSRRIHRPTHVSLLYPTSLNPADVNIDWGRVTHLHFDRLTYQLLQHIANIPALHYLSVSISKDRYYDWDTNIHAHRKVTELRSLVSLSIRTPGRWYPEAVFAHLDSPNLQHLEYSRLERNSYRFRDVFNDRIMSELVSFIQRSCCEIQDLTISDQFLSDQAWISLLDAIPPVRKLEVGLSDLNKTVRFLDKLAQHQSQAWNFSLRWLEITACAPKSWASFFQLLEGASSLSSTVEPSPGRATKITFSVIDSSLSCAISPYIDESELHRLVQLWKTFGIFCHFRDDSYLREAYFEAEDREIFGGDEEEDLEMLRTMSALRF